LDRVKPEQVGLDSEKLLYADVLIKEAILDEVIPGAVLAIVKDGKMAYLKAFGNKSIYPKKVPMDTNTIFDLASCSKSVGTAMCMAHLLERGGFRLNDKVNKYIPDFQPYISEKGEKIDIRIIHLLTHSSGLPAYVSVKTIKNKYGEKANLKNLIQYISTVKRTFEPTTKMNYSCLNFITLQYILEEITGEKLEDYAQKNIFNVLGMQNTMYNPSKYPDKLKHIAPTEKQPDGNVLLGKTHDPLAREINKGNSGNAGVFSTAEDLAILATALMNGGEYNGRRVLGKLTVAAMTRIPMGYEDLGRSLGWDNYSSYSSNKGDIFNPTKTFGHTGYTGTSIVIDPEAKVAVILLTNRVHPTDKGSVTDLRALVSNIVAGSIFK
jgi:Beta-lactamase class C and other penicillin binding proteins